ncbi:hypothetical protein [Streptomyces sp. NPDC002580]|uniref:AbiJ-related protein n=1 Tax=Streptomyces sp. NPDC002580 TaxID=3364653 RepID=UPI0036A7AE2E
MRNGRGRHRPAPLQQPGDWEDAWVLGNDRFGLADGTDEVLLRFLAEMIHPAVGRTPARSRRRSRRAWPW